jgi:hypothetical protein
VILAVWDPSDVIALVSVAGTVVIGATALVINHRRELALHTQTLEAERAKGYREQALELVAFARHATSECREAVEIP